MPLASPAPEEIHPVAVPSAQKPWGGHCSLQMHSPPVPTNPLPPTHLLHLRHPGSNPASANSSSMSDDQRPRPLAHHHDTAPDTSRLKFGPIPGLELLIPNLPVSSPSPASGSLAWMWLLLPGKELRASLSRY